MPWKKATTDSKSFIIDTIPEIVPSGALVKVAFASAHLRRNSSTPNMDKFPSSDVMNGNCATNAKLLKCKQNNLSRRKNRNVRTTFSHLDEEFSHDFEIAGRIEMLGEDVEGNSSFSPGDPVLILPFHGQHGGYSELVCVPDLRYLVRLPNDVQMEEAVSISCGAKLSFGMMNRLRAIIENCCEMPRVLIIGSKPLLLWAMHLIPATISFDSDMTPTFVIATNDESILRAKGHVGVISIVQWNDDAYNAVLVERTREACKGSADILISLNATSKMFQIGLKCLNPDGKVIVTSESVPYMPAHLQRRIENENVDLNVSLMENATPENCQKLMNLVTNGLVPLPPLHIFGANDYAKTSRLERSGQLSGTLLLDLGKRSNDLNLTAA